MKNDYLGTAKEVCWFAMEMAEQLEAHKDEKSSLREKSFGDVRLIVIDEISRRIQKIASINSSKEEMEKQAVHIGNFAMQLFLRSKYNV